MIGYKEPKEYCLSNVIDENFNMLGTFAYFCYVTSKPKIRSFVYSYGKIDDLTFMIDIKVLKVN